MEVVHDELDPLVRLERPVALETAVARLRRRREERVPAFGAEEMLFVVGAFAELFVFERDVVGVGDSSLAVMTTRCKVLQNDNAQHQHHYPSIHRKQQENKQTTLTS